MTDPLAQMIGLLRPSASFAKLVTAQGRWAVRPPGAGPFYGAVLQGECALRIPGCEPVGLRGGDFMLIPAATTFTVSSVPPPDNLGATDPDPTDPGAIDLGATDPGVTEPVQLRPGVFHLGGTGEPDVRMLVGYCAFASDDAALLVSLLPAMVVVRDQPRLTILVQLLNEETRAERPGRELVLSRLLEVLLIEAFRAGNGSAASPGLLRGLADNRLAAALRRMHAEPARSWTIGTLAREAALSRSSFFDRFNSEVGLSPMAYLSGWRMAIAKTLLRDGGASVGEVAQRVGYSSASTFSVAFTREVGVSPTRYANRAAPVPAAA